MEKGSKLSEAFGPKPNFLLVLTHFVTFHSLALSFNFELSPSHVICAYQWLTSRSYGCCLPNSSLGFLTRYVCDVSLLFFVSVVLLLSSSPPPPHSMWWCLVSFSSSTFFFFSSATASSPQRACIWLLFSVMKHEVCYVTFCLIFTF